MLRSPHAALLALFLASCSAAGLEDISASVTSPGLAANGAATETAAAAGTGETSTSSDAGGITSLVAEQEADISFVPMSKPSDQQQPQGDAAGNAAPAQAEVASAQPDAEQARPEATPAQASAEAAPVQSAEAAKPQEDGEAEALVAESAVQPVVNSYAPAVETKKRGFLSGLFSQKAQAAPVMSTPAPKPKPVIQLASAAPEEKKPTEARAAISGDFDFPGVRKTSLFEITRKSGLDDESDIDLHEDEESPTQYASAAGLGRLAPNGLLKQRESVDVACLKPSLVRMLKQVERHYGAKIVVTSGYRSPSYNRKVRGARRSMHMFCAAADVQVSGVGKWELARYVRSLPGRGGVGTYCHTNSVHIDVGPERDWNWRCRSRRKS